MPKKLTYFEKLKDPRWQKKRLEIMEYASFACESCGDNEKTLNVHHLYYEKGLEPWEYENQYLKCFCEDCHEKWHRDREWLIKSIAFIEAEGLGVEDFTWLAMGIIEGNTNALEAVASTIKWKLKQINESVPEMAEHGK